MLLSGFNCISILEFWFHLYCYSYLFKFHKYCDSLVLIIAICFSLSKKNKISQALLEMIYHGRFPKTMHSTCLDTDTWWNFENYSSLKEKHMHVILLIEMSQVKFSSGPFFFGVTFCLSLNASPLLYVWISRYFNHCWVSRWDVYLTSRIWRSGMPGLIFFSLVIMLTHPSASLKHAVKWVGRFQLYY